MIGRVGISIIHESRAAISEQSERQYSPSPVNWGTHRQPETITIHKTIKGPSQL